MSDIFSPRIGARHQDGALALRAHLPMCDAPVKKKWMKLGQKAENLLTLQSLAKANNFKPVPGWMHVSLVIQNNMKTECVTAIRCRNSLANVKISDEVGGD